MKKKTLQGNIYWGTREGVLLMNIFLWVENEVKQVCKKMFLPTLGQKEKMVLHSCSENIHGIHSTTIFG